MLFQSIKMIHVQYCQGSTLVPMGRLGLKDRKIYFEYAPSFVELGLELSPFKLPLKLGVTGCEDKIFEGLFGIFNDSLPDGWGRLLLDRKLISLGINPGMLTPLDRLAYVGRRGMGALFYEPEISDSSFIKIQKDLDLISTECLEFQDNEDDRYVDELLVMNGSSAGARPKILVSLQKNDQFSITNNDLLQRHDDWIIKFSSSLDPKDSGSIEYAYHLMAVEAGLNVPEAKLFKSKKCAGYFGVKRFDRRGAGFIHMHTLSGLLHIDHRIPSFDYEYLMKTTLWLTKDVRECEKQFRYAVFNALSHNRDDHAKNFSFLMNEEGAWCVSPAYDLNYSSGPAGEHCTTFSGEGKNPQVSHFLKLAKIASIKQDRAMSIIEEVKEAVSRWGDFANSAQVSIKSRDKIQAMLNRVLKNFHGV